SRGRRCSHPARRRREVGVDESHRGAQARGPEPVRDDDVSRQVRQDGHGAVRRRRHRDRRAPLRDVLQRVAELPADVAALHHVPLVREGLPQPGRRQPRQPAALHVVRSMTRPADRELLVKTYAAFNARDVDATLAAMHPDVDWPDGMEGGRVRGHPAVRDYWTRQWSRIDPHVEPRGFAADERQHAIGTSLRAPDEYRLPTTFADVSNLDKDHKVFARDDRRRLFAIGNRLWHSDSSFKAIPAKYSLLHARAIPSKGGNTEFA